MRFAHTIDGTTIRVYRKTDRRRRLWVEHGTVETRERPIYADPVTGDIDEVLEQIGTETETYWQPANPARGQYVTTPAEAAEHNWYPVTETDRPDDTTTTRHTSNYVLTDDEWVQTWTAVAKTQEEQDAEVAEAAEQAAADQAETERETERNAAKGFIDQFDEYLGLSSPTSAQTRAVVRLLVRAVRRIILDTYK